jgi:hypothetical protein
VDAAELRWPETPDTAAKWLLKAWDDAEKVGESAQDQRLKELYTRSEKAALQARILRLANKYDPKMAEKFKLSIRSLVHFLAQAQGAHVGPHFFYVCQTLGFRARLAGVCPAQCVLSIGRPD